MSKNSYFHLILFIIGVVCLSLLLCFCFYTLYDAFAEVSNGVPWNTMGILLTIAIISFYALDKLEKSESS